MPAILSNGVEISITDIREKLRKDKMIVLSLGDRVQNRRALDGLLSVDIDTLKKNLGGQISVSSAPYLIKQFTLQWTPPAKK